MEHVIAIVALVLTGPLVGVELGVAAFTNPLVAKLPDDAYRVFRSGGSRLLGALMPSWYIGTLVVLIAGAVLSRNVLTIAAVALMAAALVLTVTVLVPINNRIGAWRSDADVNRRLAGKGTGYTACGWACSSRCSSHWPSASCDFGALTPAQRPSARRNRTVLADRRAARYS
jgi:hypothetical protein